MVLDPEEPPVRPMVEQAVRRRGASAVVVMAINCLLRGFMGDCRVCRWMGWLPGVEPVVAASGSLYICV